MLTDEQRRRLPKAKLVHVWWVSRWPYDYRTRSPFFLRWRNANSWGFMFGPMGVSIRAPWLEHAARRLHPEVFAYKPENPHD